MLLCILAVVTIGFQPENYTVNEVDGSVSVGVFLLSGTLEREVTVQFSTISGSATINGMEATSLLKYY